MGKGFDADEAVQALIHDPKNYPVLLYPGREALNLSEAGSGAPGAGNPQVSGFRSQVSERQLTVFLLDATWSGARKMLRLSPSLQRLPRIMFTPSTPSRYIIKQQPVDGCLSTLEAVHELLTVLARTGLDHYPDPAQLLGVFQRMQDFQISCAADPNRGGYRRQPYGSPAERTLSPAWSRRLRYLKGPLT
jgi:DTW domain-containing protein YfiP